MFIETDQGADAPTDQHVSVTLPDHEYEDVRVLLLGSCEFRKLWPERFRKLWPLTTVSFFA